VTVRGWAGVNPGMAPVSTIHPGNTVDEFFDRRPE